MGKWFLGLIIFAFVAQLIGIIVMTAFSFERDTLHAVLIGIIAGLLYTSFVESPFE